MKKGISLSILALLVVFTSTYAQHRSETMAQELAQQFLADKAPAMGVARGKAQPAGRQLTLVPQAAVKRQISRHAKSPKTASETTAFYIFNDDANNRYVVVSADERLQPILGYSERGLFDRDSMPCGMIAMLESYNREYAHILEQGITKNTASAPRKIQAVSPLIKTDWGQDGEYVGQQGDWLFNTQCPKTPEGDNCVTGCVATAMAQIMNYHKYPARGQGTKSYTSTNTEENLTFNLSMDFSSQAFDWTNMLTTYKNGWNTTQKNAVAYLMKACGYSVNMKYGFETGSGAFTWDVPYAMVNYFKYNPNMVFYREDFFTSSEWESIIQEELAAKRPILFSATDPDPETGGGHAFILDGCSSTGYYHFNWGWNGYYDDYYLLSALNPGDSNFSAGRGMVCRISPQTVGQHENVFYTDEFSIEGWDKGFATGQSAAVKLPGSTYCFASDANTYDTKFTGYIVYGIIDSDGEFKPLGGGKVEITNCGPSGGLYSDISLGNISFSSANFPEGSECRILPAVYDANFTSYTPIRTAGGESDYFTARVSNGRVILYKGDAPNNILVSSITLSQTSASVYLGNSLQLSATVLPSNATDKSVSWTSTDSSVASVTAAGKVTAKKEGTAVITCMANDGSGVTASCTITAVDPAPKVDFVSVTCDKTELTQNETLVFHATLKNRDVTRNIQTMLVLCDNEMNFVYKGTIDIREYKNGMEVSVDYTLPLDTIAVGQYKATVMHYSKWLDDNKWWWTYGDDNCVKTVTITDFVPVQSITLSQTDASLQVGQTLQLSATVLPENATDESVTWTTSDGSVATVSTTGLVTAVAAGTATITCSATDGSGVKATCTVKVSRGYPEPNISAVTCENSNLTQNDELKITATFYNYGVGGNVRTVPVVMAKDDDLTLIEVGGIVSNYFPASQSTTLSYSLSMAEVPEGEYYASVLFYVESDDEDEEGWYYSSKCLVEITVSNLKGDVNGDCIVNGTDLVALTNIILGRSTTKPAADVNQDGYVNGTDYVVLVNIVLERDASRMANDISTEHFSTSTTLQLNSLDIAAGETKELTVSLQNPGDALTLLQFDLTLPEGLSIQKIAGDYQADMAGRTSSNSHQLSVQAGGTSLRFLLASPANALIAGTEGAVVRMAVTASSGFAGGTISLHNILGVSPDEQEVRMSAVQYDMADSTTGIYSITGRQTVPTVYNLHGQRMAKLKSGINIMDGKKLFKK